MLTIYLTKHMIQAVAGAGKTISVDRIYQQRIPAGLFTHSGIADAEELSDILQAFWVRHQLPKKDVTLVLDSGQLVNKFLTAPILRPAAMRNFLAPEFSDIKRSGEQIFGYWIASEDKKSKMRQIMATMAERTALTQYIELFAGIGVQLTEIVTPLCSLLAMLRAIPDMNRQTAVVQLWNGSSLTNILLMNGDYVYSRTTQMFQQPGTANFSVEVARQIGRFEQFVKAQQLDASISHVYLAGISPDDLSDCMDGIAQIDADIAVSELEIAGLLHPADSELPVMDSLIPISALFLGRDYIGLIRQMGVDPERVRDWQEMGHRMRPVAVLGGAAVAVIAVLGGYHLYLSHTLDVLTTYNESPLVVRNIAEYDQLAQANHSLQARLDELNGDVAAGESYPVPSSTINRTLEEARGAYVELDVRSYDAQTGVLTIDAMASEVDMIHAFIANLRTTELFYDVTYTGYNYDEGAQRWSVHVVCTLSQQAGR